MGVEEGNGILGECRVGAQGRNRLEDAWWRVLREPLEDLVPGLGDPRPDGLASDRVDQERTEDGEAVLAADLGHGEVERAEAEVHVGEDGQRPQRPHLFLWRLGGLVPLEQGVVVSGSQELGHDRQRGRLDVGRDGIARAAADR